MPNTIFEAGRIEGYFGWPQTKRTDNPYPVTEPARRKAWDQGFDLGVDQARKEIAEKRRSSCDI